MKKLLALPRVTPESAAFAATVLVAVARARKAAGDVREALALLVQALSISPQYHEALYQLGVLADEQGRLGDARLLLERAVAAEPSNVEVRRQPPALCLLPPCRAYCCALRASTVALEGAAERPRATVARGPFHRHSAQMH